MSCPKTRRRPYLGIVSATLMLGAFTSAFAGSASAEPTTAAPYGGFSTAASATPLRLEIFEPAIPIPADPQAELDFSYTTVTGASGPDSTAMASAMWPGSAVGDGLPTIVTQAGLPAQLALKYPVHVNAQYPGTPNSGSQEFLPGSVGRVSGSDKQAVARAGYSTSGQVAGDASGASVSNALDKLKAGDLGALGDLMNGPGSSSNTTTNPLGLLSVVINVGGMSSSSVTDYSDPSTVTATATSQVGDVELLGGIVKLEGVTVSSVSSSSLDGAGATQKVTYGGLTIAGTPFKFTSDGIEASTSKTKIPGLSSNPLTALKSLGISIELPDPTKTVSGTQVTAAAQGPVITIDTQPALKMLSLGKLPLGDLVNKLPDSANQLKGLVQAALQAHPKIVVALGDITSSAQTIASIGDDTGGTTTPIDTGSGDLGTPAGGDVGAPADAGSPDASAPPAATSAPAIKNTSAPGLPPLGSVPGLLTLGGLIIAAGLGWFFRAAALSALGAGTTCTHGLATGLPDLRKA